MKRILPLLAVLVALAGCEKKPQQEPFFREEPTTYNWEALWKQDRGLAMRLEAVAEKIKTKISTYDRTGNLLSTKIIEKEIQKSKFSETAYK